MPPSRFFSLATAGVAFFSSAIAVQDFSTNFFVAAEDGFNREDFDYLSFALTDFEENYFDTGFDFPSVPNDVKFEHLLKVGNSAVNFITQNLEKLSFSSFGTNLSLFSGNKPVTEALSDCKGLLMLLPWVLFAIYFYMSIPDADSGDWQYFKNSNTRRISDNSEESLSPKRTTSQTHIFSSGSGKKFDPTVPLPVMGQRLSFFNSSQNLDTSSKSSKHVLLHNRLGLRERLEQATNQMRELNLAFEKDRQNGGVVETVFKSPEKPRDFEFKTPKEFKSGGLNMNLNGGLNLFDDEETLPKKLGPNSFSSSSSDSLLIENYLSDIRGKNFAKKNSPRPWEFERQNTIVANAVFGGFDFSESDSLNLNMANNSYTADVLMPSGYDNWSQRSNVDSDEGVGNELITLPDSPDTNKFGNKIPIGKSGYKKNANNMSLSALPTTAKIDKADAYEILSIPSSDLSADDFYSPEKDLESTPKNFSKKKANPVDLMSPVRMEKLFASSPKLYEKSPKSPSSAASFENLKSNVKKSDAKNKKNGKKAASNSNTSSKKSNAAAKKKLSKSKKAAVADDDSDDENENASSSSTRLTVAGVTAMLPDLQPIINKSKIRFFKTLTKREREKFVLESGLGPDFVQQSPEELTVAALSHLMDSKRHSDYCDEADLDSILTRKTAYRNLVRFYVLQFEIGIETLHHMFLAMSAVPDSDFDRYDPPTWLLTSLVFARVFCEGQKGFTLQKALLTKDSRNEVRDPLLCFEILQEHGSVQAVCDRLPGAMTILTDPSHPSGTWERLCNRMWTKEAFVNFWARLKEQLTDVRLDKDTPAIFRYYTCLQFPNERFSETGEVWVVVPIDDGKKKKKGGAAKKKGNASTSKTPVRKADAKNKKTVQSNNKASEHAKAKKTAATKSVKKPAVTKAESSAKKNAKNASHKASSSSSSAGKVSSTSMKKAYSKVESSSPSAPKGVVSKRGRSQISKRENKDEEEAEAGKAGKAGRGNKKARK